MVKKVAERRVGLLPPEPSIKAASWLNIDYKLFWYLGCALLCVAVLIISSLAKAVLLGLGFDVSAALTCLLFVGVPVFDGMKTTPLAKLSRFGSNKVETMAGRNQHSSEQPKLGEVFGEQPAGKKPWFKSDPHIKKLGKVEFIAHSQGGDGPPLGIAYDRRFRTYSATMELFGSSVLGADPNVQNERLDGFAALIDMVAAVNNPVEYVVWRDQTLLGEPQDPKQLVATLRRGAQLEPRTSPDDEVFNRRLIEMGEKSVQHRTTMTLAAASKALRRDARSAGSPEEALVLQLGAFYSKAIGTQGASPIGLRHARFLSYNQLILETRLALDPVFAQQVWEKWHRLPGQEPPHLISPDNAWPGFADFEAKDHAQLGQTYQEGLYIAEFTPSGVSLEQFWQIVRVPVPKIVTTVIQMVPAQRAQRRAEWTTTGAEGSNNTLESAARRVTASQERFATEAGRQEKELAERVRQAGRMRMYIQPSGSTTEEVATHAAEIRKAAYAANFELESLVGRHDLGVEAAMPFGRGLASIPLPKWP